MGHGEKYMTRPANLASSTPRRFGAAFFRGIAGLAGALVLWEVFARSGLFSVALTPPLGAVVAKVTEMISAGMIFGHTLVTMARVLMGLAVAFVIAVPLGIWMGNSRTVEKIISPTLSVLMPIPSLAWVPLFVLWFGIGNFSTILVVIYASIFTMIFNTWTGVRAINQIWYKSAVVMGANSRQMLFKVMLPGTMPYIISGLRISFGRAWIAVIGGELLASPDWGLGKIIFDAREFLDTESMLSALVFIGLIGIGIEKLFLKRLEKVTIERWGMSQSQSS
jgi:NitT/TauT family transport system permease protein